MAKEGSPNKRNKRGHEKDKKPIGAFSLPSSIRQQCIPWEIRKGLLDRPDWPDARNFCRLSLPLTAVSWFLHRKPSREPDAKTNERASKVKCGGGGDGVRRRRAQKVASHRPTCPTLISSHSEIPTSDTGDIATTPNASGVAVCCVLLMGGRGLVRGRRRRRFISWAV